MDKIRQAWRNAKLIGHGYSRAGEILQYAKVWIGYMLSTVYVVTDCLIVYEGGGIYNNFSQKAGV